MFSTIVRLRNRLTAKVREIDDGEAQARLQVVDADHVALEEAVDFVLEHLGDGRALMYRGEMRTEREREREREREGRYQGVSDTHTSIFIEPWNETVW